MLTKEQVMNLKYKDAVHLIKWRYDRKTGQKIITTKENTLFCGILENGKYSFQSLSCRPKNVWIELYGTKWCLEPPVNSYEVKDDE